MIESFAFASTPKIYFGIDSFLNIGALAGDFGKNALIITGSSSFQKSGNQDLLCKLLSESRIEHSTVSISQEPSPEQIDTIAEKYRHKKIKVVIAIGGGSVVDAGKAVSAMLVTDGSVTDYLEGVGSKTPPGSKIPFIAVPTTAGTGSETTKNAVISSIGEHGYKKSLRHDNYVPDIALIDPKLSLGTPASITASCGMDALSQLLESYLSCNASPITDALALSGMQHIKNGLIGVATTEPDNLKKRTSMAYGAMLSGITLANAGLGIIHGIAGPLGGFVEIPHGLACGTLLNEAMSLTIKRMDEDADSYKPYLEKCSMAGSILSGSSYDDTADGCKALLATLKEWSRILKLPRLSKYGITAEDVPKIVKASSNKNNPIKLSEEDIVKILNARL